MFKKTVAALMLAGLASGQAFALQDAGFEDDTKFDAVTGEAIMNPATGGYVWANGAVARSGATQIFLEDERNPGTFVGNGATVSPIAGNYFGVMLPDTTASSTMLTFNLGGLPTVAGDSMAFRLFSSGDLAQDGGDGFSVTYFTTAGISQSMTWTVADSAANGSTFDSNWITFAPAVGTTSMVISLFETSGDVANAPVLAVDFSPAAPVPEPESIAMMLAGLGVLGAVSRRRAKKAA